MLRHADANTQPPFPPTSGQDTFASPMPPHRRAADQGRRRVDVLSAEELAQLLGCETQHINALAAAHALPAVKIGRSWRFPAAALNAYLNQQALAHVQKPPSSENVPSLTRAVPRKRTRPDLSRAVKVA